MNCPNGHVVQEGASICPVCFAAVGSTARHETRREPPSVRALDVGSVPRAAPTATTGDDGDQIIGQLDDHGAKLLALADRGYDLIAMVGLSQHGKSELMRSIRDEVAESEGKPRIAVPLAPGLGIKGTDPNTYYGWTLPSRTGLTAVWDMAGENFKELSSQHRAAQSPHLLRFVSNVLPKCRGIVLTMALHRLWSAWEAPNAGPDVVAREALDQNMNTYVRFIQVARIALSPLAARLTPAAMANDEELLRLSRRCPPMRIPVVVNFSMADRYGLLRTPPTKPPVELRGWRTVPSVSIDPEQDDALVVLYLYAHQLYQALARHARFFKAEFSCAYDGGPSNVVPELRKARSALAMYELIREMNWTMPGPGMRTFLWWHRRTKHWQAAVSTLVQRGQERMVG